MADLERFIALSRAVKESGHTPSNPKYETYPLTLDVYQTIFNGRTELIPHPDFSPKPNDSSQYTLGDFSEID